MSELKKVKLGKRLSVIAALVGDDYDHIWDCCCDHGLLGLQLLGKSKAKHIHFVDIVSPLLIEIETKLKRFYQGEHHWHVHCLDVALLPLQPYKNEKQLIIIAGIGGLLLVKLLTTLLPLTKALNVEFILSPVHHHYQLRHFLNEKGCGLIDECIVAENGRFYEVIHIKPGSGLPISRVGDKMWDFSNVQHQTYLQQTISHYQRLTKNPNSDVSEMIKAYQDLTPPV
ncbi:tRNA (adenine(22)-N(1))-methyltransferase TrmK [Psychromonas hadalis]|uniref:tRNA (adenine(22)-N(1))-methyltransferase TrmK n=1 Tax=Psychromonas hadalis TaxID=211669 RepID=UPI0003B6C87F|nr:tRNA (adenine(22)-N(1))-methyltransferase TrmK [Psychromonas hadalis]